MIIRSTGLVILGVALSLILASCGAAATSTPAATEPSPIEAGGVTATPPVSDSPASPGQKLFVSKGCAACHGQEGEGSDIAPGLAGHTLDQTKRQIRAPLGLMPVFPPDKVSNSEMEEIAEYVASLSGGHGHGQSVNVGDTVAQHHWMALFALEDEDQAEAVHHINHLLPLVAGEHQARMREALSETEAGSFHDAAHLIEEMLAGLDPLELTAMDMHLRLSISAARVGDATEAIHQMEHYLEFAEEGSPQAHQGMEILELMKGGELAEAEHQMTELAGMEEMGHQDEGEPHQDAEPHQEGDPH